VRLWYVAATRARELLVLPRLDVAAGVSAWISVVDLALPELPSVDMDHHPPEVGMGEATAENTQTRAVFASEAAAVAACHRSIVWRAPSRDEGAAGSILREEELPLLVTDGEGAPTDGAVAPTIQGGRERGLILHKLIEEVLTGETAETTPALVARAETLIWALGRLVTDDPSLGLVPAELAGCVVRALSMPEVAALRPGLQPEYPVYASTVTDTHEEVTAGIVDAIAFGPDGAPEVVIDWKSDVDPSPETLEHYCSQVRAYLDTTGAARGLVIAVTIGAVLSVMPTGA
jgi:exodeoxyribonuclease-5